LRSHLGTTTTLGFTVIILNLHIYIDTYDLDVEGIEVSALTENNSLLLRTDVIVLLFEANDTE
jgi:hypothetical protein